jgi:E3 ubiquitin-protein ligase HERC2
MHVPLPEKIHAVACGEAHTVAITASGKVLSWGKGEMGQLGHGNTKDQLLPRLIETFRKRAVAVACGQNHTALLTEEGQLYIMGANK